MTNQAKSLYPPATQARIDARRRAAEKRLAKRLAKIITEQVAKSAGAARKR